jgi:hypothetical protein
MEYTKEVDTKMNRNVTYNHLRPGMNMRSSTSLSGNRHMLAGLSIKDPHL